MSPCSHTQGPGKKKKVSAGHGFKVTDQPNWLGKHFGQRLERLSQEASGLQNNVRRIGTIFAVNGFGTAERCILF